MTSREGVRLPRVVGIRCTADIQFGTDKGLREMIPLAEITQSFIQNLIVHGSLPDIAIFIFGKGSILLSILPTKVVNLIITISVSLKNGVQQNETKI